MLYDPARHEALIKTPWNPDEAQREIQIIVDEAEAAFSESDFWPEHPLEREQETQTGGLTNFYFGAAGVLWALQDLEERGLARLKRDYRSVTAKLLENHTLPDNHENGHPGFLAGKLGVIFVAWKLSRDPSLLPLMKSAMDQAIPKEELEFMWGASGAMAVARHLHETTRDEVWRETLVAGARRLLATWAPDEQGRWIWTQDLYGQKRRLIGHVHGFAGNAAGLLAACPFLGEAEQEMIRTRIGSTLKGSARREGHLPNWDANFPDAQTAPRLLLQYCHGAPSVLVSLYRYPIGLDLELERMLVESGDLIWKAGPLVKPHGICHGTAGNAYAFHELSRRTGDPVWLERSRAFATHAMQQSRLHASRHGRRRFSFWTGDLGLAVFLGDLLQGGDSRWPGAERL